MKNLALRPLKNGIAVKYKRGQTLIEFALVSILFLFMMVVSFNAIIAFSVHQYISYAVFMAARAYQAAGENPEDSKIRALATFNQFSLNPNSELKFDLFNRPVAKIINIVVPQPGRLGYGKIGVTNDSYIGISFEVPFVTLPLGESLRTDFASITLEAKSFLGRQPAKSECLGFFKDFLGRFALQSSPAASQNQRFNSQNFIFMDDNGC